MLFVFWAWHSSRFRDRCGPPLLVQRCVRSRIWNGNCELRIVLKPFLWKLTWFSSHTIPEVPCRVLASFQLLVAATFWLDPCLWALGQWSSTSVLAFAVCSLRTVLIWFTAAILTAVTLGALISIVTCHLNLTNLKLVYEEATNSFLTMQCKAALSQDHQKLLESTMDCGKDLRWSNFMGRPPNGQKSYSFFMDSPKKSKLPMGDRLQCRCFLYIHCTSIASKGDRHPKIAEYHECLGVFPSACCRPLTPDNGSEKVPSPASRIVLYLWHFGFWLPLEEAEGSWCFRAQVLLEAAWLGLHCIQQQVQGLGWSPKKPPTCGFVQRSKCLPPFCSQHSPVALTAEQCLSTTFLLKLAHCLALYTSHPFPLSSLLGKKSWPDECSFEIDL